MGGTVNGGRKAAATNKRLYGLAFYRTIGRLGGRLSRNGGFSGRPDLAREAGSKGGAASRRGKAKAPFTPNEDFVPSRFRDVD